MSLVPDSSLDYFADDRRGVLIAISIIFATFTTIMVAARFYAKRFQGSGGFFADDAFLLSAYAINLGMCALGIVITQVGGVGRHVAFNRSKDPEALVGWGKCLFAFEVIYFISIALPKLSIICLYLRLFSWRGYMRGIALALFWVTTATSTALTVAACFQCMPLAFFWDRTIPGGRCFDIQGFFHAQAIPGFIIDVGIMMLPVSTIWSLKMRLVKRLALVGVFVIASFGIVASIIRATIFFGTEAFQDETWASVDLIGWSIIETGVYIITCCLPHMRPLISHHTPSWLKKAVRMTLTRSTYGSASKGRSEIYKSTGVVHSYHIKTCGGDVEDAIELTGSQTNASWGRIASVEDLELTQSSEQLKASLEGLRRQRLGVTTNITSGSANYP